MHRSSIRPVAPAGATGGMPLPAAGSHVPQARSRELLGYTLPLVGIAGILASRLVADWPGPGAAVLVLLLMVAATGWLAGERAAALAVVAAILAAAAIALDPVPGDQKLGLVLFAVTAIVTGALASGLRRREATIGRARLDHLEATEAARDAAESRTSSLARLQRLSEAVARQLEPAEMASRILAQTIEDVGATAGAVLTVDPGGTTTHILASAGLPAGHGSRWEAMDPVAARTATDAIRRGEPLVLQDAATLEAPFGAPFEGLTVEPPSPGSAIVVPLPYGDRIVGGLYLRYPTTRQVPAEEVSFLMAVAAAGAAAIERSRLYAAERTAREAAERAAARLSFLADASQVLAASLDLDATLRRLTGIAVPTAADWCTVRLVAPDGSLTMAAAAHADPGRGEIARSLMEMQPARLTDLSGGGAVARTGRRRVVTDLAPLIDAATDLDPAVRDALRRLDLRTVVTVPLGAGRPAAGVLTLAWAGSIHAVDDTELWLAEELASRAATAIENARLHGDLEAHARHLQARTAEHASIARLGQRALAGAALDDLFDDALRTIRALTASDRTILVQATGSATGRIRTSLGWSDATVGSLLSLDGPAIGRAIRTARPVRTDGDRAGGPGAPEPPASASAGSSSPRETTSDLAVPVAGAGGPWGALAVRRRAGRPYGVDDEHFVGAVANVLAAAIDRDRQAHELAERDERLEVTLASSRTGTWEWDAGSGRIGLSAEACAMHGLPHGRSLDGLEALVALAHPSDRDRLRQAVEGAIACRGGFELEYRVVRPDGSERWVNGLGRVFSEDRVGRRLLGLVRDISERKRAEAERERRLAAEREAREVGRAFIGVISHEVRTPITAIYAGSKLLQRETMADTRRQEIARDVEAEAERLYRLTEDLLVLTRLERGDLRIGGEPVLAGHIVRRVVASEQARWPRVRFVVRERRATHPALGEEIYVEQVARNLLSNAAKYSPPGEQVDIVIAEAAGRVSVRVLDRGPGVGTDPEQLFELFYRAPQTASQASGAGIGLFVCKRLVEAMQGRLWARPRPGGGSEFGFDLGPYEESALAERPTAVDEDASAGRVAPTPSPVATGAGRPGPPRELPVPGPSAAR